MTTEKLVLFKPRRHRQLEVLALPLVALPVGPGLRWLLGDGYSFNYGMPVLLLSMLLVTTVASRWSARHGGVWITPAERLRRLVAETSATPAWQTFVATTAMMALTF